MDDLLYLQHTTTFNNLIKILYSGKLYTGVDMWFNNVISEGGLTTGGWYPGSIPDQYPGVYMKLVHKNLIRQDIEYYNENDVQLIFCISLLQRQDFHYNHVDSNGFILSKEKHNPPTDIEKYYTLKVAQQIKEEYIKIL